MMPRQKPVGTCRIGFGTAILVVVVCLGRMIPASAEQLSMDPARSTLKFRAIQQDAEFEGRFDRFDTEIDLDTEHLDTGYIRATIDLGSVDTSYRDRDDYLLNEEWFHTSMWPNATFETTSIRRAGDGQLVADAELTLRDVTRAVIMNFQLDEMAGAMSGRFRLTGTVELKRLDFGVGQGDWTDTTWVGDPVTVLIDLDLKPADEG